MGRIKTCFASFFCPPEYKVEGMWLNLAWGGGGKQNTSAKREREKGDSKEMVDFHLYKKMGGGGNC